MFVLFSCSQYGFFWGQFGKNDVDARSSVVRALADSPDLSAQIQIPPVSSKYSVLVMTDLHFGATREDLELDAFLSWLENWFKTYSEGETKDVTKLPRFAINLGDTADGGHDSEYRDYLGFEKQIKKIANRYLYGDGEESTAYETNEKFKVYSILGNHDLYNNGSRGFEKLIFPYISSYHFTVDSDSSDSNGGFSYYFLDTANGTMGQNQLEDFKEKLDSDPLPKIILTHYPVWAGGTDFFMILQNTLERNTLLTYFVENNVRQVYEGHAHKNYGYDFKKFREDVIGSLHFSERAAKQCAIFTVDEAAGTVETEIIEF